MVRVLIDATAIPADRGGVGRYLDNLVPELARLDDIDAQVLCQARDEDHYRTLSGRDPVLVGERVQRRPVRLLWEQTGLIAALRRVRPDVLHSPHYTHPVLGPVLHRAGAHPTELVVTLHDATFFSDPSLHTRVKGPFFRAATRSALRRARLCLVDSQASADELVRLAGARREQLQVAHLGVDLDVFAPPAAADVAAVRTAVGLEPGQRYLAFLGTLEPRKNVPALIRAWVSACAQLSDPPALVLAGGKGWDTEVDEAAAQVPSSLRLLRPGYLPLEQLPALLGGAEIVCYPSLGEGFGLPVLEAMACGACVLTTRRLSLAEVGGDAVAYTETDSASIAAALTDLLADDARRAALAAAGRARAQQFSWRACAEVHAQVYRRAAAQVGS